MYNYTLLRGLVFSALLAYVASFSCNFLSWNNVATTGTRPTNIGGHSMVSYGGNLYVFGGFFEQFLTATNTFYSKLYKFDTSTDHWTVIDNNSGPSARAFHGADTVNILGKMYIYGGITYNGDFSNITIYEDFWKWDFSSGAWSTAAVTSVARPGPRTEAGFAVLDGQIYLFGGIVNEFFQDSNELWRYNPVTGVWTLLHAESTDGSSPSARHGPQFRASQLLHKIYLYGGEITNEGFAIAGDTWVYDPSDNSWTDITPADEDDNIDPARNNLRGSAAIGKKVVLYGGDAAGGIDGCGAPFPQNPLNETWQFNTDTGVWRKLTRLNNPPKLKRNAGASVGNCFVTHGGWNFPACQVWNDNMYTLKINALFGTRSEGEEAEPEEPAPPVRIGATPRPAVRLTPWNGGQRHPLLDVIARRKAELGM